MKPVIFIVFLLFSGIVLYGQTNIKKQKPFIIQGELRNYPVNEIHLVFTNKKGSVDETIAVDKTGKFYF